MALRRRKAQHFGLAAAGMSALTLAVGCGAPVAQTPAPAPVAEGPHAAGAKFQVVNRNGQLHCTSCDARLNAQGRHQIGETLVRAVQYMKTPEAFAKKATKDKLDLKGLVVETIAKIGHTNLGIKLPSEVDAGADRVNQFPDPCPDDECWRNYVAMYPGGCCIPDGVPVPDPPY